MSEFGCLKKDEIGHFDFDLASDMVNILKNIRGNVFKISILPENVVKNKKTSFQALF